MRRQETAGGPRRAEPPDRQRAATAPEEKILEGPTKKERKTRHSGPPRTQAAGGASGGQGGGDERCGQEGASPTSEKMGCGDGGRACEERRPPLYVCRSQLLTARRLASPGPRGAKAADGAAATSRTLPHPCLPRPGVPPPSACCCARRAEGRRAPGAPTCGGSGGPSAPPCSPGSLRLALP